MKKRILSWISTTLILLAILSGNVAAGQTICLAEELSAQAASIDREDGEYQIQVELEGGTGRATVTSPAVLIVKDSCAYARIEWSSSKFDYMIVAGEKYLPINEDGNSVFEIPVLVFDEPMTVIADTTAMSVPHEVEYTFTFASDQITSGKQTVKGSVFGLVLVIISAAGCLVVYFVKKKQRP
ncbi:MAG: hypothetical protein ACI4EG_06045 [Fusicatenibacter sp.]|nr:hypothetical protein [Fusicatenibacter sp.]